MEQLIFFKEDFSMKIQNRYYVSLMVIVSMTLVLVGSILQAKQSGQIDQSDLPVDLGLQEPTLKVSSQTTKYKLDDGSGADTTNIGAIANRKITYNYSIVYPSDYACSKNNDELLFDELILEYPDGSMGYVEGSQLEGMITMGENHTFSLALPNTNTTNIVKRELFVSLLSRDPSNSCRQEVYYADSITDVTDVVIPSDLRIVVDEHYEGDSDVNSDQIKWTVRFKEGSYFGLSQKMNIECSVYMGDKLFYKQTIKPWVAPHDPATNLTYSIISTQTFDPFDLEDLTKASCKVTDAAGKSASVEISI